MKKVVSSYRIAVSLIGAVLFLTAEARSAQSPSFYENTTITLLQGRDAG